MPRAAWRLACISLAMALCITDLVTGQPVRPDIFDTSVGGLSDCGASRLAGNVEPGSDHGQFLSAVLSFVEAWERWRQAYNAAAEDSESAPRGKELKLWQEVEAAGRALRETAYAREKFTFTDEAQRPKPRARTGLHHAAWNFASSWYQWLSRHVTHAEKGSSDLEALRGDAVLFLESMDHFLAMEELRPAAETP